MPHSFGIVLTHLLQSLLLPEIFFTSVTPLSFFLTISAKLSWSSSLAMHLFSALASYSLPSIPHVQIILTIFFLSSIWNFRNSSLIFPSLTLSCLSIYSLIALHFYHHYLSKFLLQEPSPKIILRT